MRPAPILFGLAAALAASPAGAHGYTLEGISWPGGTLTLGYDPQNAPINANAAITLAIATWQAADPALHITYLGKHPGDVTIDWGAVPAVADAAVTHLYPVGPVFVSATITLNTAMPWGYQTASYEAGVADLPSTLIHELGHALGLGHSTDPLAVMFPSLALGDRRRTLTVDDIAAIRAVYPPKPLADGLLFATHTPEVAR